MNRFRFYIAVYFAKVLYFLIKVTKITSGTSVLGLIALKICPKFLESANNLIKGTKINITGTNGKTTTSGIISHVLSGAGENVVNNSMGANMINGIVNAYALQMGLFKKFDYSVMECDEANLEILYEDFDADYLLVTNLFRDQLDRYGELATTKRYIQSGIDKKEDIQLILNADDPLVATFSSKNKQPIYYGINKILYSELNPAQTSTEEIYTCKCGKELHYSEKFYAQQGHYYCDCGFKRPDVKYNAEVKLYKTYSLIILNGEEYEIPLVGLFNAYNVTGAVALCLELGINPDKIKQNLKDYKVVFGRSEVKYINNHRTLIQLIKNPIGANEVLKTVDLDSDILVAINDNYADGRDVSWLWDAEFEYLSGAKNPITVTGSRAYDIALRLKYGGVKNVKIIKDIEKAVDEVGKISQGNITILPTYTALLKINKLKQIKKERLK